MWGLCLWEHASCATQRACACVVHCSVASVSRPVLALSTRTHASAHAQTDGRTDRQTDAETR
eukprot:1202163-Alexandrium_andersonii.AAC.1